MLELLGKYSFVIISSYLISISLLLALILESLLSKWGSERKLREKEKNIEKSGQ